MATTSIPIVDPGPRSARGHERAVKGCTACGLHKSRTHPVIGDGPRDARLMIVTDVPRRHEDVHGHALAGSQRNVVDQALLRAGLDPDTVRRSCVVRCRTPGDRPPTLEEATICSGHLSGELALVEPQVVVALGELATNVVLGRAVPFARVVGYRLDVRGGITLIPTYHPAEVARGVPAAAKGLRRDLATAKAVLDGTMGTGAEARRELRSRLRDADRPAPADD
ncbi:MAG: uracil-DNA glycosylase [Nitriliruptoraceae bacterium]